MSKSLIFKDALNVAYMTTADNFRGCNHDTDDKIEILSTMIEDVKVTDSKVQTKGIK